MPTFTKSQTGRRCSSAEEKGGIKNATFRSTRNSLKTPLSSEPKSMKLNNFQLAKENAKLRKDMQKYVAALSEYAIKCDNLELAWRRRDETFTKIDILARLVGNHISDLVDTLTELRSACQTELSTPLHERLKTSPHKVFQLRHSIPLGTKESTLKMNSRSQLVNLVNPMISGLPIIKPTISLQRLELGNIPQNVQEEQIQVQSFELHDVVIPLERLSLSQIAEFIDSPVNRNMSHLEDQEDSSIVSPELPSHISLNDVKIPLERLSLSQIAEFIGSPGNRNVSHLEDEEDNSIFVSPELPPHVPLDTINEESSVPCSSSSSTPNQSSEKTCVDSQWPDVSFNERSRISNQRSYSNNARKCLSTSHISTPTPAEQSSEIIADVVVALKDVGSYLRNGTLTNIELLEERKVRTGASVQHDVKVESSNTKDGPEINLPASGDQTKRDYTGGIEAIKYDGPDLYHASENQNSFSPTRHFFNRLRNEDPLEGPSWRYGNVTVRDVRKRQKPHSSSLTSTAKKNKQDTSTSSVRTSKETSSSVSSKSKDEGLNLEPGTLVNLNPTVRMTPCEGNLNSTPNNSIKEQNQKNDSPSDILTEVVDNSETCSGISPCIKKKELSVSLVKIKYNSDVEPITHVESNKRNCSTVGGKWKKKQNKMGELCSKKDKIIEKYSPNKCKKNIQSKSETLIDVVLETKAVTETVCEQNRARRAAAPKCLKEPQLNNKLRQP